MKKLRILIPVLTCLLLSFGLLACGDDVEDFTPGISCPASITLNKSETFYFLDGVSAVDSENGNITHKVTITVSAGASEIDGKLIFDDLGVYVVEYTVYDAAAFKTYKASTVITVVAD